MTYLFAFISAMVISMAIIPLMARLAPRIGMVDRPDPRKVHAVPIPRAGGVGIVLGALVPIAIFLPIHALLGAYLFGAVVLLIFGVWDDIQELGHYTKFVGQLIAVVPVVYYGDLYITHLPFIGMDVIPDSVGKPFTVFALIGMINAVNHSDGLDGLAGGLSILSLACIGYLAFLVNGNTTILIALSTIGGVFGFLRYNTYPARVFMGDGGSQFLGFTLGFLAVLLVDKDNSAISPALPLLILGLPIVDILGVFAQRVYHGMNWFRASKNHIHHRLLQLEFHHYETVVIIYALQCLLVVSAIFMQYESDWLISGTYLIVCGSLFLSLIAAERCGWHAHRVTGASRLASVVQAVKGHKFITNAPTMIVAIGVPAYFMYVSIGLTTVPGDFGAGSALLSGVLFIYLVFGKRKDSVVLQAVNYAAAAFMVYLGTKLLVPGNAMLEMAVIWYFGILAVAVALAVRYGSDFQFSTTPMDYLVVFIVVISGILLNLLPEKTHLGGMVVETVILFYACELIITSAKRLWSVQNIATMSALIVLGAKSIS